MSDVVKNTDYLRQVIVVRKDLSMPRGKMAAMVAHAAMTFITSRLRFTVCTREDRQGRPYQASRAFGYLTREQGQWLTEIDDGIEETDQVSFAKIILGVESEAELRRIDQEARAAGLETYPVYDSGYSHNPKGTLVCIAIGPDTPDRIQPVTGDLPLYR